MTRSDSSRLKVTCTTIFAKPVWVTPTQAVRLTGIGRTLLYQLIAEGKLKSIKLGGKRLISFTSIENLEQHASEQ
jgi:excisionase family DNA binding protein